ALQLTHLELQALNINASIAHGPLLLQSLKYLNVTFSPSDSEGKSDPIMRKWAFPKLQTLIIDGEVESQHEEPLLELVMRHIDGLTGLGLPYTCTATTLDGYHGPARVTDTMWINFRRNLSVIKIDSKQFWNDWPPFGRKEAGNKSANTPFIVVIKDFACLHFIFSKRIADSFMRLHRRWKVKTFVCSETWERVKEQLTDTYKQAWESQEVIDSLRQLLGTLQQVDATLMDSFHVPFQEVLENIVQFNHDNYV
ncbi:hypothetical protein CPB86DRAFT_283302, partial [Serendipita vermifera]